MQFNWNIRRKLNAVLTLCGLLFIGIFAPIISHHSYEEYKTDARTQQARLVGAVETSAAIATFVANEEIASEVLSGLLQDDEIVAVELAGADGFMQRAQSERGNFETLQKKPVTAYPLSSPVESEKSIGEIRVWSNEALISERARRLAYADIALLVCFTLALAIVSMYATNYLVARPLRRLADQVSDARPGSSDDVIVEKIHAKDEIGLVAKSVNGFLSVTRNALTKERELRNQIEKMNQHFSNIFATSNVGIIVVDEQGILLQNNPVVFERIIKLNETQQNRLANQDIFSLAFTDPEDIWSLVDIARTNNETADADVQLASAWHKPCWVHCILTINHDEENDSEVIEIVLYDVSRRIHEAEAAKQLAEQDPLTGLHNRRGCDNYLQQRFRRPEAKAQMVAMLLDLDGFKPVNDTYGHNAGDEVLTTIAKRLQAEVRSNIDLVARIGGDEFVVLLKMPPQKSEPIEHVAQKIIKRVSHPIMINEEHSVQIGVSIGIAYAKDHQAPDALMQAADEAMYTVKTSGKNDFAFAS